jgi:hypothetical protein
MSRRALIVLAVTAALLGGYVLLGGREPAGEGEERRILPGLQRERVARIRIVSAPPAKRVLEVERTGGETWRLTAPLRGRADRETLSRLLALLEFLEPLRAVPDSTNRRQLGLLPPRAVITLFAEKKGALYEAVAKLEVGRLDPSGHGVYLGHQGALHVVDRELSDMATGPTDAWRDPRLGPAWTSAHVRWIKLARQAGPSLSVELKQGEARLHRDGGWIRVDPTAGRRLLAAIAGLRASRFSRRGGALDAAVRVTVEGKGGRIELQLGGPCAGRPAERQVVVRERGEEPVWCCVEREDLLPLVDASEDSLVDRRLLHVGEADLERVEIHAIQTPKMKVELVRDAGRWRYARGEAADGPVVREWMEELSRLEGTRVERGGTFAERRRIELGGPGQPTRVLRFGAASGGELPARRGEERAVVWIPEGQAQKVLQVQPLYFRSRQVVELSHHLVNRLVTTRGREREVLVRGDDGWELVKPVRAPVDQAHVAELLRTVSRLRATRLREKRPRAVGRTVTLELTVRRERLSPGDAGAAAEEVTRLQLFLPPADGPCFAHQTRLYFEIEPAVCCLLSRRRADRRLLRSEKAMTQIELSLAGQRLTAEKRGPAWHDASGKTLDTTAVAELIQTLRNLKGQTRYDLKLASPSLEVRLRMADGSQEGFLVDALQRSRRLSGEVTFQLDGTDATKLRKQVRAILGR